MILFDIFTNVKSFGVSGRVYGGRKPHLGIDITYGSRIDMFISLEDAMKLRDHLTKVISTYEGIQSKENSNSS